MGEEPGNDTPEATKALLRLLRQLAASDNVDDVSLDTDFAVDGNATTLEEFLIGRGWFD